MLGAFPSHTAADDIAQTFATATDRLMERADAMRFARQFAVVILFNSGIGRSGGACSGRSPGASSAISMGVRVIAGARDRVQSGNGRAVPAIRVGAPLIGVSWEIGLC